MGTNEKHPSVRRHQQAKKRLLRACKNMIPHHSRKWWKAWSNTWEANYRKADWTEEGDQNDKP